MYATGYKCFKPIYLINHVRCVTFGFSSYACWSNNKKSAQNLNKTGTLFCFSGEKRTVRNQLEAWSRFVNGRSVSGATAWNYYHRHACASESQHASEWSSSRTCEKSASGSLSQLLGCWCWCWGVRWHEGVREERKERINNLKVGTKA